MKYILNIEEIKSFLSMNNHFFFTLYNSIIVQKQLCQIKNDSIFKLVYDEILDVLK